MNTCVTENKHTLYRWIIGVLCLLLVLSLAALAVVTVLHYRRAVGTDVVPGNRIASLPIRAGAVRMSARELDPADVLLEQELAQGATVELYQGQGEGNLPFQVANMLPGDSCTQRFAVEVSHENPVELYFSAIITRQTKNLGKALTIRVVHIESGEELYSGTFEKLAASGYPIQLPQAADKQTVATYEIRVSLPTSAGNEYQAAMLMCDLQWYVSDQGSLVPPQTGDRFPMLLWGSLALASAGALLLILYKKKEAAHG